MNKAEQYKAISKLAAKLATAEKKVATCSAKYKALCDDFNNHTSKARAGASDRSVDACEERGRLKDDFHALLVDADLTPALPGNDYETRTISQSAGHGHSIRKQYTPAKPKSIG